jgi:PTH1 family peptidyl-tRNA hydrolase
MGIGRAPAGVPPEEFVLSPFSREELEEVASLVERAAQAVAALLTEGLVAAQNRFHRAPVSDT